MWGIHNDQSSIDPVTDGAVRISWDETGDLSNLTPTREAFKERLATTMPELGTKSIPGGAGTLYRFVHEIALGDLVVSPDRARRTLNIGRVVGPYEHHPEAPTYQHWRPVEWLRTGVDRDELSLAAKHELGSATTLFRVTTGREEIERLVVQPQTPSEPDFGWTRFYAELADALAPYVDDRPALLSKVWHAADVSGVPHLFKYLQNDHYTDGGTGPLRDVDPFTILATFNRGITDDARTRIASAYRDEFGLSSSAPTEFPGAPLANNLKSWFIKYEEARDPQDVDALWHLFDAARAYAATADEESRETLVSAFDRCATGNTPLLTMGLYWCRPDTFTAYDGRNTAFIQTRLPELASDLALGAKITGEQFLDNTQTVAAWLDSAESPYHRICELSHAAYTDAEAPPSPEPDPVASAAPSPVPEDPYGIESIREDGCFIPESELGPMVERLASKKNLVLQGPPGTGKTWLARRLGWALCGEKDEHRVRVLQFHPSLAYEDFVRGWRPSTSEKGGALSLEDGPFLQACRQAADDPGRPYVLVIEEINRGNPAQIFGELLTLIEADKRNPASAMSLAYPRSGDERFFVPPNLHLIGTMNVADRSLAMVDMALRRRFAFVELRPRLGVDWVEYVGSLGYDREELEEYGRRLGELNTQIGQDTALGRQYGIGHSFVTPAVPLEETGLTTRGWWQRVVETDLRPLLEEYWFDRPDVADKACRRLLAP